ncbi:GATA transcription factor 21, partial [Frankliniella fusca]
CWAGRSPLWRSGPSGPSGPSIPLPASLSIASSCTKKSQSLSSQFPSLPIDGMLQAIVVLAAAKSWGTVGSMLLPLLERSSRKAIDTVEQLVHK